jgi:dihydroflavonol-4-reductase
MTQLVLVTGVSGFIAMHITQQLLDAGYHVRGTLRSLDKGKYLREVYSRITPHAEHLSFHAADLTEDAGWETAVAGCAFVIHVASPFPSGPPRHEDELIIPAREGTLRVLRAAAAVGTVKRLVLTSSVAAIIDGRESSDRPLTEADWSDLNGPIAAYSKSKTVAEMAAWSFMETENPPFDMVAINPGTVLGPIFDKRQISTSIELVLKLLRREVPGVPALNFPVVDVRDVAAAHLAAMTSPAAAGKRYICSFDSIWMAEIAEILRENYSNRGYKIPTRKMPGFLVRLAALFDPTVKLVANRLNKAIYLDNSRIKKDLNWQPHDTTAMITALTDSLITLDAI